MNQELSTTEEKQVEQAAAARGGNSAFDVGYEQGFRAGIEYALKELLPSRMIGFAEYCGRLYEEYGSTGEWIDRWSRTKVYTTTKLYQKYITEYLKQQQDDEPL